jgi:hypothetical protein
MNSQPMHAPSKVMDASPVLALSRRREALAEGVEKRAQNSVLALGGLISFGFRKKRHQVN